MKKINTLILKATGIASLVIIADQILKEFVRQHLAVCHALLVSGCERLDVIRPLGLVRAENAGSAFGFLQGLWVWVLLAALGFLLIPIYGQRLQQVNLIAALAVGLQSGGAMGNLLDRVLFGRVTDFIDFGWGLIFNLADVALAVGMLMAIVALRAARTPRPSRNADGFANS